LPFALKILILCFWANSPYSCWIEVENLNVTIASLSSHANCMINY
jgi:hypothetical protein